MREAGRGRADWGDACRRLTRALPGSAAALVNYDLPRKAINAAFTHGIDEAFLLSYGERYARVNPWLDFMADASPGVVYVSERDYPARSFRDSAFYGEWLAPQGNMDAVAAVQVRAAPHNDVQIAWHYESARAGSYDTFAAAVLEGLKPCLFEAVENAIGLRDRLEGGKRLGPLIERIEDAAVLIDRSRRIRETNGKASAALNGGQVLASAAGGVLALRDQAAQRWLEDALAQHAGGVGSATKIFASGERIYRIAVTPAPEHEEAGFALLLRPRPLALVTVRLLVGEAAGLDHACLRFAFDLSAAEIRLCELLVNGHSLAGAAQILGLSDGTVRQRVKAIFNKTGTHRQGELVARLARFCAEG